MLRLLDDTGNTFSSFCFVLIPFSNIALVVKPVTSCFFCIFFTATSSSLVLFSLTPSSAEPLASINYLEVKLGQSFSIWSCFFPRRSSWLGFLFYCVTICDLFDVHKQKKKHLIAFLLKCFFPNKSHISS